MDDKIRKSCPNCCQLYQIIHKPSGLKGNLPLFLSCGHTICENCIRSLTKFQEPIECKVCLRSMELKAADVLLLAHNKSNLYKMFPVNYQVLGELTLQLMQNVCDIAQKPAEECFIDIQGIMMEQNNAQEKCVECHKDTQKMCKQCDNPLCDICFNKTHKNFVIFKNHALQKIAPTENKNNCQIHDDKQLDYYCIDCSKTVCMDCLLVGSDKSCKEHNLKSTSEINDTHMEQIILLQPKVDETFRRLSKTAVDIGQLLYNIDNGIGTPCEVTQIITSIEQHFSKLCAIVQKHKKETINLATKVKSAEKESLVSAKKEVYDALKKANEIMRMISSTADTTRFKQMNLSKLLEDAKKVIETPWFLLKEENKTNALKMNVNEDLNTLISDYIHLEGNASSVYKLCTPEELEGVEIAPPPPVPVFPPQLPRDVRQLQNPKVAPPKPKEESFSSKPFTIFKNAPSYRSKSASVNSLNSASSDSSRSYRPDEMYQSVPRIKPYMQGQEPRQPLVEGSQEIVYMSHIVDPHNFYVQRACDQKLVKDILREYRNSVSEPKPLLCNIAEGKIYLAYCKADNLWQRCRVVGVERKNNTNQPRFIVYCFDFGSFETVSINNLRLLPPAKWYTPPPLAIHCSLANCEPINGEWMNDDSILIQNILDNKQAVIHVRRVIETEGGIKLDCDVTTFEEKVSLAHAFVFHDRAKMPNPKLRYPIINTIGETPKIFTSNSDFKPKSIDEIYFTHIVSPDKFYVRKRQHQRDFIRLSEELNQEYSLSIDHGKIFLPELGMACVVNTEKYRNTPDSNSILGEDCAWARCVVTEMAMRGRVRVQLVDSGLYLLVHWSSLRAIQTRFTTLRALATECHLAGVTPHNRKWSPASVALLKKYQNHVLEMEVDENRLRGSVGVTLFDKTDEENIVCINDEMVKFKFAITFGMFNFTRNTEDLKDQSFTYKSPLDRPVQQPKPKIDQITILQKDEPEPKQIDEEDLIAKDKGPLRLEAKILNYISPATIYLSLVHQQKMFSEMFENIQKYYNENKTEGKTDWQVSEKCCVVCMQSQTWRRASILELNGPNAKVFYLDFATVETVQTTDLRVLVPEFAAIGVAALKCHLCGVMPAIGEEWPSLTKEFLKELLDAYNRVFITKIGNFKENSMPIQIWVYHTIQGGALEPNNSEWRCLNDKIIAQGLGIPIKSEQLDPDQNGEKEYKEGEEVLSFLNVTGLVSEWLQLEPMPTKPLLTKTETESGSGSSTVIECEDANDNELVDFQNAKSIFISDWLPAEPFHTNEFAATATFIDNDGIIYLHQIAQEDTFDLIRNALSVRYRDPDPKANYMKWTVGEPCVALYHYDNSFYRGKVMEVNQITYNCLVHYIDFGNEEVCSFANMRKSIALHQIPIQAHKCVFSGIKPIGIQWERQTLDYIHKLIVEKRCFVRVTGKTLDGITPIVMKYDKLWINDHLVEFELAKYIKGVKATNRKVAKINTMTISERESVEIASNVETDSGPDFIVEDEDPDFIVEDEVNTSLSEDNSFDLSALKGIDWNVIVAEDNDNNASTGKYITFPKLAEDEFKCDITAINDTKVFPLNIIQDAETNLIYEEMFQEIQQEGDSMPPLKGIFKNKACIALFEEDKKWYRALILEYSKTQHRIKVRYVDYDNVELVSIDDAREILEEWVNLPPRTVFAKFHGVDINPETDVNIIRKEFSEVLLNKGPFYAKIINSSEFIPSVELRDSNNALVSDKLIENGVFVKV